MKKIVLVGVTGALNSGDHALCAAVIRFLREIYPTATLLGIHRDPELQESYFPDVSWLRQIGASNAPNRIKRRMRNLAGLGTAALKSAMRHKTTAWLGACDRPAYEALCAADLVVPCPGGWLEDNHISIWANLVHLNVATAHGVPVFFAPQSIGPFRKACSRRAAARVFSQSKGIALRDQISEDYVRCELAVRNVPLKTFPDMAFYENEADQAAADVVLGKITGGTVCRLAGTTVLEWSFPGASDSRRALREYLAKVAETARELFCRHQIKTVFLRQIRDAEGYQGDRSIIVGFRSQIGEAGFVCEDFLDPQVLRGVIRRCEVFWGTRLHANIFAMTQFVPVVGIAYQHKTEGIMRMMGQGEYVVQIDRFTVPELIAKIELALVRKAEIVATLATKFGDIQRQRVELGQFLQNCLGSARQQHSHQDA